MHEFGLERYQDSAQGRASVRGRETAVRQCDFPDDEDGATESEARAGREEVRRGQLKARIQACISQMETICPPIGVRP